jgi:hypothetical protein
MATTARGHIEKLPSGSFRVHVYAGIDPVTGKPRRLKQTCLDEASAAAALGKLLSEADGDRFPDREATLGQALFKYMEVADLEVSTREAHEGYVPPHDQARARGGEDPQAGRGLAGRPLHGLEEVLPVVPAAAEGRTPHRRRARVRWAVRAAARPSDHPPARL